MAGKPGFMMYHDDCRALGALTDASFRRVIEGMLRYSETGEEPELPEATERVVFGLMRNKIDADDIRYQRRVEAGRKGGLHSGEVRRSNAKQNEVTRSNAKQSEVNEPTTTPNPTPTPTPTTTPNPNTSLSPREGAGGEREIPLPEEVREYAERIGLEVDAEAFVLINRERGWRDSFGNPIRDWRLWLERSPLAKRKEEVNGADDQPPVAGSRDEYGGVFL